MAYIKAANHIVNLDNLIRCSKYSFQESKDTSKWWLELSYIGENVLNISFNTEKEWLDGFDSVAEALCSK